MTKVLVGICILMLGVVILQNHPEAGYWVSRNVPGMSTVLGSNYPQVP